MTLIKVEDDNRTIIIDYGKNADSKLVIYSIVLVKGQSFVSELGNICKSRVVIYPRKNVKERHVEYFPYNKCMELLLSVLKIQLG
jgi:hypothetical protein